MFSANTSLTGSLAKYKNMVSLVTPFIIDSAVALQDDALRKRVSHLANWGMSTRGLHTQYLTAPRLINAVADLCEYIGDALLKLRDGPITEYIPDFNFNLVKANIGASTMYAHLVSEDEPSGLAHGTGQPTSIKNIVCKVLDVDPKDISADVPLTTYGLDSLSAATLSYALAPILRISQIQLLADISLHQLEDRVSEESDTAVSDSSSLPDTTSPSDHMTTSSRFKAAVSRPSWAWTSPRLSALLPSSVTHSSENGTPSTTSARAPSVWLRPNR